MSDGIIIVVVAALIVLFIGEPDLHDYLLEWAEPEKCYKEDVIPPIGMQTEIV